MPADTALSKHPAVLNQALPFSFLLVILGNLNKSAAERRAEIVLIMESPQIGRAEPLPYLALRLRCDPSLFVVTQLARVSQSRLLRDIPANTSTGKG